MTRANFSEFVLDAMPGAKADIVIKSGVSQAVVLRWVRLLHAGGKIYIANWKPHPRAGAAMAAAAYAKDLLGRIAPNKIEAEKRIFDIVSEG